MGDRAHQRHGLAQSQAARLILQRRPARAVADHQQMGLGDPRVQRLERLEQNLQAVPGFQAADEPDHPAARKPRAQRIGQRAAARGIEALGIDRVRNQVDARVRHSARARERDQGLGDDQHGIGARQDAPLGVARQRPQLEAARTLLLPDERRVDLEQMRHAEPASQLSPGHGEQGVALVDELDLVPAQDPATGVEQCDVVEKVAELLAQPRLATRHGFGSPHRLEQHGVVGIGADREASHPGSEQVPRRRLAGLRGGLLREPRNGGRREDHHLVAEPGERPHHLEHVNRCALRPVERHAEVGAHISNLHREPLLSAVSTRSPTSDPPSASSRDKASRSRRLTVESILLAV